MGRREQVDPLRFVAVWTKAKTLDAVAKKMGMTKRQATTTASVLRARGVVLKSFKRGPQVIATVETLNAQVAKAMGEQP